jgi:hypothetical protein
MSSLWRVLLILAGVAAVLIGKRRRFDRIPHAYIDGDLGRLRCRGSRCVALVGEVGLSTACAIYTVRPHVRLCNGGAKAPAAWCIELSEQACHLKDLQASW